MWHLFDCSAKIGTSIPMISGKTCVLLKSDVFTFLFSLAGVSRSVTVAVAYIMTVTDLSWREALNAVRGARKCANPNFGFQRQLQAFEFRGLKEVNLANHYGFVANIIDFKNSLLPRLLIV
jgi:hypothetical protein